MAIVTPTAAPTIRGRVLLAGGDIVGVVVDVVAVVLVGEGSMLDLGSVGAEVVSGGLVAVTITKKQQKTHESVHPNTIKCSAGFHMYVVKD